MHNHTNTLAPRHNLDTSPERLGSDWVYCPCCGWPIRRDEVNTTSCDPRKKREYDKYLARKARIAKITARMEARRQAFEKAQAADNYAIYQIERGC